jgi:hypothetical protein
LQTGCKENILASEGGIKNCVIRGFTKYLVVRSKKVTRVNTLNGGRNEVENQNFVGNLKGKDSFGNLGLGR